MTQPDREKPPWLVEDLDSVLKTKYPVSVTGKEEEVFRQVDEAGINFAKDHRATVIHPDGDTETLYFKDPSKDDGRGEHYSEYYNFSGTRYPNKTPR